MTPTSPTLTSRLAAFVIDTPSASLGAALCTLAQAALVDTLGCALAAFEEPVVRIARDSVPDACGAGLVASVWGDTRGDTRRVAMADAAFVNAIASHALDFDDNMPTLRGHPSTTLVPTVLAVAEACGASGLEAVAAYVLGVEVAGKLGVTMGSGHYVRGWHPTSTVAVYGATAAAARLLGLSAERLATAWAIAASQSAGLTVNFGTMTKPFHAGHAARNAVQAVLLARAGFTAHPAIFDGPRSAIATYRGDDGEPLAPQLDRLGAPWEVEDPGVFVKRWPCCYCSHRPISGLLQLMQRERIGADEVLGIAIGFPPGTDAGLVKAVPRTGLAGKFSIEYTAAAAVTDGDVTLASFTDAALERPDVQALMARVRVHPIEDTKRWSATVGYNDVVIETARGRFAMRVHTTPGSPQTPLSASELDAKFTDCARAALGDAGAAAALRLARDLQGQPDCTELIARLRR
ncbi:MAG TPA: MmgE/PrpD family protein [Burkholderiaceae bacterium]|jgi:2-methylcitrate dehydratase PrpD